MTFGEKLKALRTEAGMSQAQLAGRLGVTERSIHNYEADARYPKGQEVLRGIAETFGVTTDYLVNDAVSREEQGKEERFFVDAAGEAFGRKGRREAARLLEETGAMFAGGALSQEDKDAFFQSITQAYFAAKNNARKKYGHK
ncbi:MAG: helix-turn-helix transcriptional regulator [Peptococcaceae bacterium]|nr:helix-turn-helix transcriptional regulator [Peptococcaceae bacterium]